MIEENDVIRANKKLSNEIVKGTEGVVLCVFHEGKEFLIEFVNKNGETIGNGMETVRKEDVDLLIKVNK